MLKNWEKGRLECSKLLTANPAHTNALINSHKWTDLTLHKLSCAQLVCLCWLGFVLYGQQSSVGDHDSFSTRQTLWEIFIVIGLGGNKQRSSPHRPPTEPPLPLSPCSFRFIKPPVRLVRVVEERMEHSFWLRRSSFLWRFSWNQR